MENKQTTPTDKKVHVSIKPAEQQLIFFALTNSFGKTISEIDYE
jgi:hypothetical protein